MDQGQNVKQKPTGLFAFVLLAHKEILWYLALKLDVLQILNVPLTKNVITLLLQAPRKSANLFA